MVDVMNKSDRIRLENLALKVRRWAEDFAIDAAVNGVETICPTTLCGMCAIASAKLFDTLIVSGFDAQLHSNTCHCFVTVKDGYDELLVDLTATQFDGDDRLYPSVYIRPMKNIKGYEWTIEETHPSSKALREYQLRMDWDKGQQIPEYLAKEIPRQHSGMGIDFQNLDVLQVDTVDAWESR